MRYMQDDHVGTELPKELQHSHIAVPNQDAEQQTLWLTVFAHEFQVLMSQYNSVFNGRISLESQEELSQAILNLTNFTLTFERDSNIARSVTF
jgi:hypothetical protein